MQAVILAGGKGTRLRPLTYDTPKPMVPIHGKPFLEYLILFLKKQGFKDFLLLVSYLGEQVQDYFGNGKDYGVNIDYAWEKEPLGTAGALKNAQDKLQDEFILFNGDTLMPIDVNAVVDRFKKDDVAALVVAYDNNGKIAKNNLLVGAQNAIVSCGKKENKKGTHVDAGVTIFKKSILEYIPVNKVSSLEEEIYPKLINDSAFKAFITSVMFYDMGSFPGLDKIKEILAK